MREIEDRREDPRTIALCRQANRLFPANGLVRPNRLIRTNGHLQANGLLHTSPGQRPGITGQQELSLALKARFILHQPTRHGTSMRPGTSILRSRGRPRSPFALGRLALALLWLLVCLPAWAGTEPAPANKHTLWRIQGPHSTIYLLGSIHVLRKENYPLAAPIEAAFKDSQVVVFETDLGGMAKPTMQDKLADQARLPSGESLRNVLPPELYTRFNQEVKQAGLPMGIFDLTKPSVAAITIEIFALKKLGFDPEFGIDKYFYDRAVNQRKEIRSLETIDFQFHLITDFTPEEGQLLLKTTLEDIAHTRTLFGDMLQAWQTGNTEQLDDLLHYSMRDNSALLKRLVTDRNRRWVPQIKKLMAGDKNAMVVVGAGHLVGEEGLIELLRQEGLDPVQE